MLNHWITHSSLWLVYSVIIPPPPFFPFGLSTGLKDIFLLHM
uniref:Uncharacterized protein n=1 Tax=Anguilla anguilla TaxID=7936 RepID=A0A0E9WKY2_ANGAN